MPSVSWRIAGIATRIVVPIVLLLGLAFGVFYVRLLNGPVSLTMLAAPIARSLTAELGDYTVTVDDAIARLTPAGDIEFRLRDVKVIDSAQRPVAIAPLAAFSLSGEALWAGRLTPERVVLIEPRALVVLGHGGVPQPGPIAQQSTEVRVPVPVPAPRRGSQTVSADAPPVDDLQTIDVLGIVTRSVAARGRGTATAYLKELGFRQATVVVEAGGRQTTYRIPEGGLDLDSWYRRGEAVARITAATQRGTWSAVARVQQAADQTFAVATSIRGLVPAGVFAAEQSRWLSALSVPVNADLDTELTVDGRLHRTRAVFDVGAGLILTEAHHGRGIPVEGAKIVATFDPVGQRLEFEPSTIAIDGKQIQLVGSAAPEAQSGASPWRFALRSLDGRIAQPKGAPIPIDALAVEGRVETSETGAFDLTRAMLRVGGSDFTFQGRFPSSEREAFRVEGRAGAMSAETLKAVWPQGLAIDARAYVSTAVLQGRATSALLRIDGQAPGRSQRAHLPRISLAIETADVALQPLPGWPIVDVPRGLVRIEDNMLEVSVPDAFLGPAARRFNLRQARFVVPDIAQDFPQGEITVRGQGPLATALGLIDGETKPLSKALQTTFDAVEGRFEGQIKVTLPLDSQVAFRDIHLEGKGRVVDGRGRGLIGGYDVQGATFNVDLSDEAVDVQGDLLVQGVAAKLSAQHLLRAAAEQQPPIRLTATLDASDRTQLGLDLNHLVSGDVPVEVLVVRAGGETLPRVQANLTPAELTLESLGWRKAPGRPATLQFDIVRGTRHRTELQNFRIAGEDIAVGGWLGVDAQSRLREVHFPDFVLNVVSKLDVQGTLRPDNVWDMRVRGAVFDGRDFFRSVLQVGRAIEPAPGSRGTNRPGMDLRAEIDTVIGHSEVSARNVRLQLARRGDKLVSLQARGTLDGKPLEFVVQPGPATAPRRLVATSEDAGQVFRYVGFYPNAQGGRMRLTVDLDGKGPVEKTGVLEVANFRILGDPVVYDVLSGPEGQGRRETRTVRQAIDFDRMRAPFSIGQGQFVLEDADLRGPLLGATLRGKVDFRSQTLQIGGTYIPLQGLNSALGAIPGLGQILAGPRGEGVLGMTFAIQGPMAQPQVIVNPLSLVAPGIFREMFQMTTPTPTVTPRSEGPKSSPRQPTVNPPTDGWRTEKSVR